MSQTSPLETRDFEVRLDAETRTVSGIAVPFNQDANIGGRYTERFAPGAITDVTDVKLFYQHAEPIGRVLLGEDTPEGYQITAHISDTARGNEVYTLLRDGVLNKFSVGFAPVEQTRDGNTVTRTKVDLKEVSVVAFPAYSGAAISEVREEETTDSRPAEVQTPESRGENMDQLQTELAEVRSEVAEVRRLAEAGFVTAPSSSPFDEYRSYGEFVQGYAKGEDAAFELARAATTSADAALRPGWLGTLDVLIAANRTTASMFNTAALPATGLTVEWAKVNTNTLATGKQTTENTALTDGNIAFTTVSSTVATYGSQTSISKQTIERSTVPFLDTAFRAMNIGYAKKTNADVIATLAAQTFTTVIGNLIDISASVTAATVAGAIADGSSYIYQNAGFTPEFILCDTAAYKKLVTISETGGRPLVLGTGQGFNNIGTADLPTLRGSIYGVPVYVDPGLAANTVYLANSNALTHYENAGAPTRLQMENIGTLTNQYAIYGYGIFSTVPFLSAIVKIKVA
jgi:HK97 family phage prohead protease